jgi:hypothetical protein
MKRLVLVGLMILAALALLPAVAGAAPPAPKGKLVFDDDFSDPSKSKLENNLTATDYSRGFHAPGVYHLKDLKAGETHWSLLPGQTVGDGTVELDVWDNSDSFTGDVAEGVIVRAQDSSHFYAVMLDPRTGQYSVRKMAGAGKSSDLIAATASPLIKKLSDVNQLRVDMTGDAFTIYLNGESLNSFSDADYKSGGVGLIASNVDATAMHMHFDNLKVYSTSTAAGGSSNVNSNTPGTLPKTGAPGTNVSPALILAALALVLLGLRLRHSRAA